MTSDARRRQCSSMAKPLQLGLPLVEVEKRWRKKEGERWLGYSEVGGGSREDCGDSAHPRAKRGNRRHTRLCVRVCCELKKEVTNLQ